MNLGLENKRNTIVLGGLALLCGYLLYTNVFSGPSSPPAPARPAAATAGGEMPPAIPAPAGQAVPRPSVARGRNEEFHPVLHPKRQEERPDLSKIDPRLHLELLTKLHAVAAEGSGRNLFQFGPPPPPPQAKPLAKLPNEIEPVVTDNRPVAPPLPPVAPPPPPPPFKYYAFVTVRTTGRKTVFFLEGDDYYQAAEGELVKKRYRVLRIGVNGVDLEDIELKRRFTLPLAEDAGANGG